jgi:hypothetical protein
MISEQEQLGRPETVDGQKPILILTHTNAGVAALRGRLERAGVRPTAYRLLTIDGWGMRLVSMFPKRAGHDPSLLDLTHPGTDYPNLRVAAARLLKAGHINDVCLGKLRAADRGRIPGLLGQAACARRFCLECLADLRTRRSDAGDLRLRPG